MRFVLLIVAMLLSGLATAEAPLRVVYPNVDGLEADAYGYKVLDLALRKSGAAYELSLNPVRVNHERARVMIETGEVSAYDFGTSVEFERRFLPVYFPIDRGLNGYRLLVVHRDNAEEFRQIKSIDQLRRKTAGQGLRWSDIPILERAGIKVFTAPFESLFRMVQYKRIDFLPLGANEVHYLLEKHKPDAPDAVVDSNLLIIYPFGRLFFLRKGNEKLRDAILKGLETAFNDGSFQALLNDYFFRNAQADAAGLASRTPIHLENPALTPEFGRIPQKYFYQLGK